MRMRVLLVAVVVLLSAFYFLADFSDISGSVDAEPVDIGKRIYREGTGSSGKPVVAMSGEDTVIDGDMVACESCHKRSGLGTSESRQVTPPVTPDYLFKARERGRRGTMGVRTQGAGTRPAYTDESLKTAIIQGKDPAGRPLNSLMPRYSLSEKDLTALIEYLKSMPSFGAPGISDSTIHFATIVAGDVPPRKKQAMLDVFNGYLPGINTETRKESRRAENAPWHRDWKYKAYRKWDVRVWELHGDEEEWPAQLKSYYDEKPVFAVLGGVGSGSWRPVHDFCESKEMPCLFPHTNRPFLDDNGYYTIYFSRGLALEGEIAVKHYQQTGETGFGNVTVLQIYDCSGSGQSVAQAVTKKLKHEYSIQVTDVCLDHNADMGDRLQTVLKARDKPAVIMFWAGSQDLAALSPSLLNAGTIHRIYLSSKLSGGPRPDGYSAELIDKTYVVHSSELESQLPVHLLRTRGWLQKKDIESAEYLHLQADTFFTMMITRRAVKQMREKFSRELFIEILEHGTEKSLVSSVYPRLSLGPGQRYASKGGYVLSMAEFMNQNTTPASASWVIP